MKFGFFWRINFQIVNNLGHRSFLFMFQLDHKELTKSFAFRLKISAERKQIYENKIKKKLNSVISARMWNISPATSDVRVSRLREPALVKSVTIWWSAARLRIRSRLIHCSFPFLSTKPPHHIFGGAKHWPYKNLLFFGVSSHTSFYSELKNGEPDQVPPVGSQKINPLLISMPLKNRPGKNKVLPVQIN